MLSASETAAIGAFVEAVRVLLGPDLKEARLFGSRVRGEGHEDSDLDIVLIVSPGGRARRRALYDLAFDVGFAHRVQLAPLVIEESRLHALRKRERLIARTIDAEGIRL